MKRWSLTQLLLTCGLCALGWAALAGLCLFFGSTRFGWPADRFTLELRLQLTLVASVIGAALAAAGTTYQAILRNPLAEPYLLGVTSGATLGAYLWTLPAAVFGNSLGTVLAPLSQQGAAFAGAAIALVIVFTLAQRRGRLEPVTLLLVGVIVNSICSSIYLFVNHLNLRTDSTSGTGGMLRLLVGGISTNLTTMQWGTTAVVVAGGCGVLLFLAGDLNVARLSEAEAESLGLRIHRVRWIALLVASMVTAAAVAISGPIGFVGLICPHLGRLIVGTDQRRLLPVATALGAGLLAIADAVSRLIATRTFGQLPVGVLTGVLGGPFFLAMLWKSRQRTEGGS